ncbi:phage portal protein [Azomonas macrocytogenes]|uniref:Lambda family phage portal protein n=1 Tax=Azomonas macrocytogenes TaxID=69962 RepID=A0A839T302_AZOMA|nr:phage portal protein [Azomonas macrocytogenes]MBB3103792.1 lambda family phage portal protein [Azomonas macrocytogenes]
MFDSWFPGIAAKRAEQRLKKMQADIALDIMSRRFDGAAGGRRNQGWRSSGTDANAENGPALAKLRNRARDLRRNNPYAERAITGIADNVVGAGIVPRSKARTARANKKLGELWRAWAETTACDADGLENFYGLQHKIVEAVVEAGECLIRRWRRFNSDGLPIPVQLQVLEADFLDEGKNGQNGNNLIIQGVEFDPIGRRVAYWLFDQHPGAAQAFATSASKRVPAEDIIHVFLARRPGQARGYTWLAPAMQRLHSFDDMEDAVMEQAKIAACFAAFITKDDAGGAAKAPPLIDRIEPGIIQELGMGESVSFATPPAFNSYTSYSWQVLHAIAVGLGVPYELLAGDLKGVNFSSGRMGWLHFARRVDVWQWRMLIPQLCDGVWRWFVEGQVLLPGGILDEVGAEWVPPRRDMVDPSAEVKVIKDRMRLGLLPPDDALREMGYTDPDDIIKRYAEFFGKLDNLGLIFDYDPRRVSGTGQVQSATSNTTEPEDSLPADSIATDENTDDATTDSNV